MKKQLLLFGLMLLPLVASADDSGTCGDNGNNLTWTFVEETKTLTISGSGGMKNFSYDAPAWRNYRGSIQKVIIEDGVTSLGWYAFMNCYALTTVVGGNDLTSIGQYAFYGCSKLTSFTMGQKVTSLGEYVFYGTKITSILIPASLYSIGDKCFSWCASLDTVYIENLARWCNMLFIGYSNPLSNAKHAFVDGQEITDLIIPNEATGISSKSFMYYEGVTSVNTGDGVTYVGSDSFRGTPLSTIVLGKNVTTIGCNAFTDCNELTDVYVYAESVPSAYPDDDDDHEGSFQRTDISAATLHVPANLLETYKTTAPWCNFGIIYAIGEEPTPQCATPTITYVNGKVRCTCDTEDVTYLYTITPAGSTGESTDGLISLGTSFTISVKATRDGYEDSDIATTTINLSQVGDMDGDGELTVTDVTSLVNAILGK